MDVKSVKESREAKNLNDIVEASDMTNATDATDAIFQRNAAENDAHPQFSHSIGRLHRR